MPRIPGIPRNYKIPFRGTASSPIEAMFQVGNDSDQRLQNSRVHRHGCDLKQNIYKVVPRIPGVPGNYKIPLQSTT